MRTIFGLLTIAFLTFSCTENSNLKLGKSPVDLEKNVLNLNIPEYFSDEKNFDQEKDHDLFVEAEERSIEHESGKITHLVYYNVEENKKKLKLAKFGSLNFENLQVLTDMQDEKTFMIAVSKDSLTTKIKNNLIKSISEKYGDYREIEQMINGNYYQWEKDNMVLKLSVRSNSQNSFDGYDRYNEVEETVVEESSKADQSVKLYILTKDFENLLKDTYTGSGIFNEYF